MSLGFGEVACSKRGIMSDNGNCGAFKYEPTKRIPEFTRIPIAAKVNEEELRIS